MTESNHRPAEDGLRVLVVDDDPNVLAALRLLLSQEQRFGFVDVASSAREMLERAERSTPDVLLLDLELPGLRPEMLEAIRAGHPGLRFIGMTSSGELATHASVTLDQVVDKMQGPAGLQLALNRFSA